MRLFGMAAGADQEHRDQHDEEHKYADEVTAGRNWVRSRRHYLG
jgi:hypothetical protein